MAQPTFTEFYAVAWEVSGFITLRSLEKNGATFDRIVSVKDHFLIHGRFIAARLRKATLNFQRRWMHITPEDLERRRSMNRLRELDCIVDLHRRIAWHENLPAKVPQTARNQAFIDYAAELNLPALKQILFLATYNRPSSIQLLW